MLSNIVNFVAIHSLLVFVGVTGAIGDIALNKWAKSSGGVWLLVSYAFWLACITLFGFFLRSERFTFSGAVVIAMVIHVTTAVLCDLFYFGGHLTKQEYLGILFAMIALILFEGKQ